MDPITVRLARQPNTQARSQSDNSDELTRSSSIRIRSKTAQDVATFTFVTGMLYESGAGDRLGGEARRVHRKASIDSSRRHGQSSPREIRFTAGASEPQSPARRMEAQAPSPLQDDALSDVGRHARRRSRRPSSMDATQPRRSPSVAVTTARPVPLATPRTGRHGSQSQSPGRLSTHKRNSRRRIEQDEDFEPDEQYFL